MRGMSPRKRLGAGVVGVGGFALGCGCRDAKAVAVAASSSASPYSATATDTTSTATTATWRGARAALHPSSASTGTLTVPSASSSSLLWEAEADGDTGEEVDCEREASAPTVSFSGLLRQLNDLEQSVVSWGRKSAGSKQDCFSPATPPPAPARPAKQRSGGDSREGHGNFSPPPALAPAPPSFQFQTTTTQQHRKAKSMDRADGQAGEADSNRKQPPPPPQPNKAKQSTDRGGRKEDDADIFPAPQAPKHRKAKSSGAVRLDGSVAVVKQSEDPLSDFRRSMVNMIVENRIVTGDELRELLRHFLALNAPHHHDAILRAFTEIWDEAFSSAKTTPHREPAARATPPRPRPKAPTPPRRRHAPPPRAWR
ncbi:hypothetical protein BS78_06G195500 [Paspalum vaginatum]|nr:hypothetical protein BS78_06G195500 [Paspalum vaginatum]